MSDLLLEKEVQTLKRTVQSFVREHVEPAERSNGQYVKELPKEEVVQLYKKAQAYGIRSLGAKQEWGGAGLSLYTRTILLEEASQHRLGLFHPAADAFGGGIPAFLEKCSPEQIDTYVKPAIKEGKGCFISLWEEQEDNHIDRLSTLAVRDGDQWVISGKKSYIQNLKQSSFGVVLVNCQINNGEQKPTLFLIEIDDRLEVTETVLIDVQQVNNISFNQYRIHEKQIIGSVGEGAELIRHYLAEAQIELGARCLGIAVKALDYGKEFAKLRITRGKPLAHFPSIRTMLTKATINIQAARLIVSDAAQKVDSLQINWELAAQIAKMQAIETAADIIDDVLQILGGAGFAGDLPIERWYKEIRIARLSLQKSETIIENVAETFLDPKRKGNS